MFDSTATINIDFRSAQGKVEIAMRWPSDEEWSAHRKRRKIFQRQLGRGAYEPEIETGEADAKLYEAVKLNGAPPLTTDETTFLVDKIQRCEVTGVDLRADDAEVQMETMMGPVKHVVRIPSMDQVRKLQRTTRLISLQYNRQQIITSLEAAATLWDQCAGHAEGYAGLEGRAPVPNIHKDVAIRAVISAIEQEATPKNDEANF